MQFHAAVLPTARFTRSETTQAANAGRAEKVKWSLIFLASIYGPQILAASLMMPADNLLTCFNVVRDLYCNRKFIILYFIGYLFLYFCLDYDYGVFSRLLFLNLSNLCFDRQLLGILQDFQPSRRWHLSSLTSSGYKKLIPLNFNSSVIKIFR